MKPPTAAVRSWGQAAFAASAMPGLAFIILAADARLAIASVALLLAAAVILAVKQSRGGAPANAEAAREIERQRALIALALNEDSEGYASWLWETDDEGRLSSCTRGLARGLGQPASALIGQPFSSLFPSGAAGAGWDRLLLGLAAQRPVTCAAELSFGNARTWWQISSQPHCHEDGAFAGHRGVAHDITAERQARRKLADERDEALRDTASQSQFLSLMGQEIRTHLGAISGYLDLLLSPAAANLSEARRREYLETLRDSSQHLQGLITGVLDLSRIEKGRLRIADQEIDAAELAEVAVKLCRGAAEHSDIGIVAEVIEGIELRCDAARIRQVLVDLVASAIARSNPGATIHMTFEAPGDGSLVFAVHDHGGAIAASQMPFVFDPFLRSDQGETPFGGMGLALPIARRIAVLHGGDVTIASAEGMGTTARLILPPARVTWPAREQPGSIRAA